jgi:hypothetical protein
MKRPDPIELAFVCSHWRYGRWHYQFRRKNAEGVEKKKTLKGRPGSAK